MENYWRWSRGVMKTIKGRPLHLSRYDDGSELKKMERFKIYLVGKINRTCCWITYKVMEREDQG